MQNEIMMAGFGGQGVLFAGQVLAYAAMDQGMEVTWIPSYGPEMRGGTANCTVVISNEEIGSPVVGWPGIVIVMNRPSLDKCEPLVKEGGWLFVNSSMVDRRVNRKDIQVMEMPANQIAEGLGDKRMANMVMVGAMLGKTNILPIAAVTQTMEDHLPARHRNLLKANSEALKKGEALVKK